MRNLKNVLRVLTRHSHFSPSYLLLTFALTDINGFAASSNYSITLKLVSVTISDELVYFNH